MSALLGKLIQVNWGMLGWSCARRAASVAQSQLFLQPWHFTCDLMWILMSLLSLSHRLQPAAGQVIGDPHLPGPDGQYHQPHPSNPALVQV